MLFTFHTPIINQMLRRDVWRHFGAILLILIAILLSFRLSNLLSSAVRGDIALSAILPMVVLQMGRFLLMLAPLALVLAGAWVLARLHGSLENTALLACGIGYRQQLKALWGMAFLLAVGLLLAQFYGLPWIYQKQEYYLQRARQDAVMANFTPNTFRALNDGSVLYAKALSEDGLLEFFYHQPTRENQPETLIFSHAAEFQPKEYRLMLHRGQHIERDPTPRIQLAQFHRATLQFPEPTIEKRALLRHLYVHQLTHAREHHGEWLNRLNPPISLLIYMLFLPILAQSAPRQNPHQRTLPIFIGYALYTTFLDLLASLVKKGQLSVWLGGLVLHGSLLLLAYFLWRKNP